MINILFRIKHSITVLYLVFSLNGGESGLTYRDKMIAITNKFCNDSKFSSWPHFFFYDEMTLLSDKFGHKIKMLSMA